MTLRRYAISVIIKAGAGLARSLSCLVPLRRLATPDAGMPKWRNWQTRQTQNLLGGNPRAGSTPAFGTRQSA